MINWYLKEQWPINFIKVLSNENLEFTDSTNIVPEEEMHKIGEELLSVMNELFDNDTINILKTIFIEKKKRIADYGFKFSCWFGRLGQGLFGPEWSRVKQDEDEGKEFATLRNAVLKAYVKLRAVDYPFSLYAAMELYPEAALDANKLKEATEIIRTAINQNYGKDYVGAVKATLESEDGKLDIDNEDENFNLAMVKNTFCQYVFWHPLLNGTDSLYSAMAKTIDGHKDAMMDLMNYKSSEIMDDRKIDNRIHDYLLGIGIDTKVSSRDGLVRIVISPFSKDVDFAVGFLSELDAFGTMSQVPYPMLSNGEYGMVPPYTTFTTSLDIIRKKKPELLGEKPGRRKLSFFKDLEEDKIPDDETA